MAGLLFSIAQADRETKTANKETIREKVMERNSRTGLNRAQIQRDPNFKIQAGSPVTEIVSVILKDSILVPTRTTEVRLVSAIGAAGATRPKATS